MYFNLRQIFFQFKYEYLLKILTFYLQQSLYNGVNLLKLLKAVICSVFTLFFKCIKLSKFTTIKLAQVLEIYIFINIFISNLSNLFQRYGSLVHMQGLLQRIGTISDATKEKDSFGTTFFEKISYLRFDLIQCQKGSFSTRALFQ